jgi:alkylmercury lyase
MATTPDYRDIPIPPDLGARLQAVFALERTPATLGDLAARPRGPADAARVERLFSDGPSRHAVRLADATRYTHCVLDALLLPLLTGAPVAVRSEIPLGGAVSLEVTPDGVAADAPDAVVSFGVARAGEGEVRQTACPFINIFPSRAAYERWAAATPEAVTMALPLAEAFAFARALAAGGSAPQPDGRDVRACC